MIYATCRRTQEWASSRKCSWYFLHRSRLVFCCTLFASRACSSHITQIITFLTAGNMFHNFKMCDKLPALIPNSSIKRNLATRANFHSKFDHISQHRNIYSSSGPTMKDGIYLGLIMRQELGRRFTMVLTKYGLFFKTSATAWGPDWASLVDDSSLTLSYSLEAASAAFLAASRRLPSGCTQIWSHDKDIKHYILKHFQDHQALEDRPMSFN